ncbi:three-Cys-motif partner protein TcmP [Georgenia muralis]
MPARGWSYWSRNKLEILQGYLPAFNRASKSAEERIYIDLMAGEPENYDRDTGETFDGSARLALASDPGFTRFVFGEAPQKASRLQADLEHRYPGAPFRVYPGDCNITIDQMLADLREIRWAPTFVFLDQQAAELRWETMAKLAGFKSGKTKAEQWILWSPAMIVKGVHGTKAEEFATRVDRLYGSRRWRQILAARVDRDITARQFRAEMVNLLRWQFEVDLGYRHTIRIPMTMRNGSDLYDMIFATDHPAGLKIMSHLYGKAAEREPRMKQEAIDAQTGQEPLFRGYDGTVPQWKSEPCWDPSERPWWN